MKPVSSIMAAESETVKETVSKGSRCTVLVEDIVADALIVSLIDGLREYRGILMNATNRDLGHGFRLVSQAKENELKKNPVKEEPVTIVDPNIDQVEPCQAEESALSSRQSYIMDSKEMTSPQKDLSKSLRDKNIRAMRLRPRQVMCSKCKQGIHDSDKNAQKASESASSKQEENTSSSSDLKVKPFILDRTDMSIKLALRKRKSSTESQESTNQKKPKISKLKITKSPIIKISFGSKNNGKGTIVKIPSKTQSSTVNGVKRPPAKEKTLTNKKHKKDIKKAKRKSKHDKEQVQKKSSKVVSKKGKHSKHHKEKKKHKEKSCDTSKVRLSRSTLQQSPSYSVGSETDMSSLCSAENCVSSSSTKTKVLVPSREYSTRNSPPSWESHPDPLCSHKLAASSASPSASSASSSSSHSASKIHMDENCCPKGATSNDKHVQGGPLRMRIQKRTVAKCENREGSVLATGDVVWGKIPGFPWWPGKVTDITVSQKDTGVVIKQMAHVEWFGSSTNSVVPCCELHPFLRDFRSRYNKKRKGTYKTAIKQATQEAKTMNPVEYANEDLYEILKSKREKSTPTSEFSGSEKTDQCNALED